MQVSVNYLLQKLGGTIADKYAFTVAFQSPTQSSWYPVKVLRWLRGELTRNIISVVTTHIIAASRRMWLVENKRCFFIPASDWLGGAVFPLCGFQGAWPEQRFGWLCKRRYDLWWQNDFFSALGETFTSVCDKYLETVLGIVLTSRNMARPLP